MRGIYLRRLILNCYSMLPDMNLSNLIDMKPSKLLKSTTTINSDAELTVFHQNTSVFREKQINCQICRFNSKTLESCESLQGRRFASTVCFKLARLLLYNYAIQRTQELTTLYFSEMKERRFSAQNTPKTAPIQRKYSQQLTPNQLTHSPHTTDSNVSLLQLTFTFPNTVSVNPQILQQQILSIIQNQSFPAFAKVLELLRGWFQQKWKQLRMSVSSRLSKLKYLLPSLIGQSFSRNEKEILLEWRKNALLHGLVYLWIHVCGIWKFSNIEEIKNFYNLMRTVISQLSYLLFQPTLSSLITQNPEIESRLFNFTAVEIITHNKDWPSVVLRVIKPHYERETVYFSENYNLSDLQARPEIVDIESRQPLFPQTAYSLKRLLNSYSKDEIFKNLKQYRACLLKEIESNIDFWRKSKSIKKQMTVQKQDILACIIYCLVRYKLDEIGQTLKYFSFLWGKEIENVMGVLQVDSYRVDLQVAYAYLSEPVIEVEMPSLQKLEVFIQ